MRYSNDPSQLGTKLGPKIADMVARSTIAAHNGLAGHKHDVGMAVFHSASNQISDEVHEVLGPILAKIMEHDPPEEVRSMIEQLHHRRGQLTALVGQSLVGSTLGGALGPIINSSLYPATSRALSAGLAQLPPDTGTLASMVARGITDAGVAIGDMTGQGLRAGYPQEMVDLARTYPDLGTALEMLRRGTVQAHDVELFMQRSGIPGAYHGALLQLRWQNLSPADLADMVVRGIKSQDEAARIAAEWGISADDFNAIVLDTGEPLALMQLLEAYRRGFIDQSRLVRGIKQSRVRDEWVDVAEKLRFVPMSISDAVRAVVQNQMSESQAVQIANQNGLEPGQVQVLIATEGNPLSRTEVEELYNRGLMTQGEVEQALRESRLKNKYVAPAFALHHKVLTPFEIERALRYQAISTADATKIVIENGYSATDAKTLVASGTGQRIQTYRNKVVASAETAYEENIIPRGEAESVIKAMGFSDQEITFILDAAEFRRMSRVVTQAVDSIRSRYVARKISKNEAVGFLDALGIPAQQRDQLVQEWTIVQEANVRTLTEAQVVKAVKLKLITADDGQRRLVGMGYVAGDATLLINGA